MEFINQSAEVWEQGYTLEDIWKHIARCTRVCYQTEKKNNDETDEEFCKRTILKNEPLNSPKNHLAMLEHGTIYLEDESWSSSALEKYRYNEYSRYNDIHLRSERIEDGNDSYTEHERGYYVTTNLRVLVENNWLKDLKYLCAPTEHHAKRVTISCTTNIGVSREFNRHRVDSIAEESTRYCNYNKRNDGQIKIGFPVWLNDEEHLPYIESHQFDKLSTYCEEILNDNNDINSECWCDMDYYLFSLTVAEWCYNNLIRKGWRPQQAREILPLATKTQLVHTAFIEDWRHFLALRLAGISGTPHPNMRELARLINKTLKEHNYDTYRTN